MEAALLTGKGLKTEEVHLYTAVGETLKEARKAMKNYLKSTNEALLVTRTEIIN